ncbi:TPA: hypothetical protein OPR02_004252 [Citrobacter koseri]|nr:hypothetical protein [Citrobacter koseri]
MFINKRQYPVQGHHIKKTFHDIHAAFLARAFSRDASLLAFIPKAPVGASA